MICKICGKEMEKQHTWYKHRLNYKVYYDKYLKQPNDGICVVCGKPTVWNRTNYRETCSIQCAGRNPNRQDKIRKTNLERYGVVNVYQIDKIKQHSIEAIKQQKRNYKCLYCGKDCGIKKFCSEDCKIKFNDAGGSYNNRKQAIQTCVDQFNGKMNNGAWETRASKIEQFEKEHNCTSIKKLYDLYGQGWKVLNLPKIMINAQNSAISNEYLDAIIEYSNTYHNSLDQQNLVNFIRSFYKGQIEQNNRKIIRPKELDIVLPELKLAIEYNGLRWHSFEEGMPKNYHLMKSIMCRKVSYRLIHIYEFENLEEQKQLLKDLILGTDNYPKNDFNKNNLLNDIPTPKVIYKNSYYTVYGAGNLYQERK